MIARSRARGSGLAGSDGSQILLGHRLPIPEPANPRTPTLQNRNRTWNWNIRGGSMLASAGRALVAVPALTSWPNVGFGVPVSP